MGDMFRSEPMNLAQLFIQPEAAYFVISELGELGVVQFRDLNEDVNAFQRKFVAEVRRCSEMERKLRYIEAELKKDDVNIPDVSELPKAPNPREIIDLEAHLEKTEGDIKELTENAIKLKSSYLELTELKHVLEKTHTFLNEDDEVNGLDSAQKALMMEDNQASSGRGRLGFIAGTINRQRVPAFERMLWRISRGNIFLRQAQIETALEDPVTRNEMYKTVFVAFFQGEQLKSRIQKVCTGFHATIFSCPDSSQQRNEMLKGVSTRLEDLNLVMNQTKDHIQRVLVNVSKEVQNWSVMVSKMKAIYHTLNYFNMDVTKKCLLGECWLSRRDIPLVQNALTEGSKACGSSIPSFLNIIKTKETPPTYNRTNKFTQGFQNLIDSYGVATYREANPALYTIITFPFLFAVMFGDLGHAIIMTAFGASLVIREKKIMAKKSSSEIFNIFFSGRYIILLMGIFSMYTGFVYNDFFSKSMNIFGTSWTGSINKTEVMISDQVELNPTTVYNNINNGTPGTPYFIGVDPVWQLAKNKIIFLNTYKMKLSIIFGVTHMIFGVCVSVINFVHFKKFSSIVLEFLPQIFLLIFLFLWMVVMIFMKWIMYSAVKGELEFGSSCAPSVLIYFINMMLFKDTEPKYKDCPKFMFDFQPTLQYILVAGSLICIPILLLGKPIYIMQKRKKLAKLGNNGNVNQTEETEEFPESYPKHHKIEEEEEPMSEIFIHQAIHTIEYVLSTISHTASYLRLWALSLAHAQLSEVLWNMLFNMGLVIPGYVGAVTTFAIFIAWAGFTIAILVLMEGLSAFLHTLRLHWVEFMSKFYEGVGYIFQPFSFKTILGEENGDDD